MPGPFYFAWVEAGEAFDPAVHNTYDQQILSAEVAHAEGEAATLAIRIKNPGVGPLTIGRWAWFSYEAGSGIVPVFNGRLIGSPSDLQAEILTLQLRAIPDDYIAQKTALAATMRVLPYWDPVWEVEKIDEPDTVLESYCALWHIDRLTLLLTAAHLLHGEDGTLDVSDHLYASLKVAFGSKPKRKIKVTGNVAWKQKATGIVDLTTPLWQAFKFAGSPFQWPQVGSYTGAGLVTTWPKPGAGLGGGWSMSDDSIVDTPGTVAAWSYKKTWTDMAPDKKNELAAQLGGFSAAGLNSWAHTLRFPGRRGTVVQQKPSTFFLPPQSGGYDTYVAAFPLISINQRFRMAYEAERDRSETISFILESDIQPQAIDIDGDDEEELTLSSEYVDKEVEADGSLPIVDVRHNAYFARPRGSLSAEALMLKAMAKAMYAARSVEIEFQLAGWPAAALALSCRKSVLLHDPRLPGGQALGKITRYTLSVAGGAMRTTIALGSSVGYGVVLPAPAPGTDVYALGYASTYTRQAGAEFELIPGVLQYAEFGGTVIDDDGVDFFNMNSSTVLLSPIVIENGSNAQQAAVDIECAKTGVSPDPIAVLSNLPTRVMMAGKIRSVTGGGFHTEYPITLEKLVIPKMIDLEAA